MKKIILFWGMLFVLFMATSCLDKGGTTSTIISEEAVITNFYLYNDSIEGISDYDFIIDEDSHLIYNYDSIAYGTRIDSLGFVITPRFSAIYINDSIDYYAVNEIFLDFSKEVKFTVVAADEKTSADYHVKVNIHKVDPDTFIWQGVNSEVFAGKAESAKAVCFGEKLIYFAIVEGNLLVYESVDGANWDAITPVGLNVDLAKLDLNYLVGTEDFIGVCVEGKMYKSVDAVEWVLVETIGVEVERLLFALGDVFYGVTKENNVARLEGLEWKILGKLPTEFPIKGEAVMVAPAPSGKERVFVVGGIDAEGNYLSSVWSSEDGVYWSDMTEGKELFTPRAYTAVVQYSGGLMMFGGVDLSSKVVEDAHLFSKDYGLTWNDSNAKSKIGETYMPRYEHSAVVTPAGYIYLIGGRVSSETTINDVWQGLNYASLPGFKR